MKAKRGSEDKDNELKIGGNRKKKTKSKKIRQEKLSNITNREKKKIIYKYPRKNKYVDLPAS